MSYELRNISFLFLLGSIMFCSCVQEFPLEIHDTEIPVVNCILTNDAVQTLSLTWSVKITDGYAFKEIKEARVTLFADSEHIGEFERTGYGNWQLRYQPVAGTNYRLSVQLPDGKELTATTTMPERNRFIADATNNHYPSKYFRQQTADNPCWIFVLSEQSLADNLMHPVPSSKATLMSDIGTDHPLIDRFNEHGNLLDLVPQSTTPAYAFYLRIQQSSLSDGEEIPFCLQTLYGDYAYIFFRTASREYDQYLKSSLLKMFMYRSEDDPIQWFDESKVYSNITNGTGIFAACNDSYIYFFGDLFRDVDN